jgi:hypothetical protein
MSAVNLQILHNATLDGDTSLNIGTRNAPVPVSVNTPALVVDNISVPDNFGLVTLWAQTGGITAFTLGMIQFNADVLIELSLSNQFLVIFVPANTPKYFGGRMLAATTERLTNGVQTTMQPVTAIKVQRNVAAAVGAAVGSFYLFD